MLNLSEDLASFILLAFNDTRKELIFEGFKILEGFSFPNYEDSYMEVVYAEDSVDHMLKLDLFVNQLEEHLTVVINQHGIELSSDIPATLEELVEICNTLLILPNLEDMSFIRYRALSNEDPSDVLVQLLTRYSSLPMVRSMELVENVSQILIDSIKEVCGEECKESSITIDNNHLKYCNYFFEFIERTPCLGLKFFEEGYGNKLTLDELLKIITFPIEEHLDRLLELNPSQAALDVLSLLLITKEDYDVPMVKFKELSEMFTTNTLYVTRLTNMMVAILNDFGMFLEAKKQEEEANRGQV